MTSSNIEIVFSFDTTGSMYPCLTQVRRKIETTVTRLMNEIPGMRIGIIAHGDYCDAGSTYLTFSRLETGRFLVHRVHLNQTPCGT